MNNTPWPGAISGYCSNVHAGSNLEETIANLTEHTVKVKQIVSPDEPMGVGLWLSAKSVDELFSGNRVAAFKRFLDEKGLIPFTFNGFPYGNFHAEVVKHDVYRPDWTTQQRFDYTVKLANVLARLTAKGKKSSISTLPLGWPHKSTGQWPYSMAAHQLFKLVDILCDLEETTGRRVTIALEPEPGCVLDTAEDVISFFHDHLLGWGRDEKISRYLGVCHDICHSAVMLESQMDTIKGYADAGIKIHKVHVSSAIEADFGSIAAEDRPEALKEIQSFHEPKYLHQTCIRKGDEILFFEDLIDAIDSHEPNGLWRSHFHVPIYLDKINLLRPTQAEIIEAVRAIREYSGCGIFEIETYAWGVLPEQLKVPVLAEGIAAELNWFKETFWGRG